MQLGESYLCHASIIQAVQIVIFRMDHHGSATRFSTPIRRSGADSSSLTSVETMPSPKTEVRHRKLSRRRSSPHENPMAVGKCAPPSSDQDEIESNFSTVSGSLRQSLKANRIEDQDHFHDSGFHGLGSSAEENDSLTTTDYGSLKGRQTKIKA